MAGELIVERRGRAVHLTLHRPDQRNAVTPELIAELLAELERIDSDPEVRVVVVTGAGKTFCAGFDITRIEGAEAARLSEQLCARVHALRVPAVAKVNGVASGTGCDLAVSCDLRIASETARFSMPPAKLGVLYETGGMARLVQTVGAAHAKELLLTGEPINAERALLIGLVGRVVSPERLDDETERLAETLAANAPLSIAASKLAVSLLAGGTLAEEETAAIERARRRVWASEDAKEGPRAFKERRAPDFSGRC